MTDRDVSLRFLAAQAVVRDVGKLALRHAGNRHGLAVEAKGVQDMVSNADREVEDLVIRRLGDAFVGDKFFGEEGGLDPQSNGHGQRLWVIDPIDGTANFLKGYPGWSISVAFMLEGRVEIGIIYDPVADELYAARRGGGATRDGVPIRVSGCTELDQAIVSIGFSYRRPSDLHAEAVRRALAAHCEYRRTGGGALGLAQVADGRFEAYWEVHMNAWDALAGLILVEEAGGWTNDFLAGNVLDEGNPIVACAPGIKEALIATLGIPGQAPQS